MITMVTERVYKVPLRKEFLKAPKYKRAKRAVSAVRKFLERHMKSAEVKIGEHLNRKLWERGIKNPPHHVLVIATKDDKGIVSAELVGAPVEKAEEKKEKKDKEEAKEKKEEKKKEVKEEKAKATLKKTEKKEKKEEKEIITEKAAEAKEERKEKVTPPEKEELSTAITEEKETKKEEAKEEEKKIS
jgi:large subunit ribosomal protein L31e